MGPHKAIQTSAMEINNQEKLRAGHMGLEAGVLRHNKYPQVVRYQVYGGGVKSFTNIVYLSNH